MFCSATVACAVCKNQLVTVCNLHTRRTRRDASAVAQLAGAMRTHGQSSERACVRPWRRAVNQGNSARQIHKRQGPSGSGIKQRTRACRVRRVSIVLSWCLLWLSCQSQCDMRTAGPTRRSLHLVSRPRMTLRVFLLSWKSSWRDSRKRLWRARATAFALCPMVFLSLCDLILCTLRQWRQLYIQ